MNVAEVDGSPVAGEAQTREEAMTGLNGRIVVGATEFPFACSRG